MDKRHGITSSEVIKQHQIQDCSDSVNNLLKGVIVYKVNIKINAKNKIEIKVTHI